MGKRFLLSVNGMHSLLIVDRKAGAQGLTYQPNPSFLFRVNNLECLIFRFLENCTCLMIVVSVRTFRLKQRT